MTVSPGGSENPLPGMYCRNLIDEFERPTETDRLVAVAQPYGDVRLLAALRDKTTSSNHRMMKPKRLTLKLLSVAVASAVAAIFRSRGVRITPVMVRRVGGFEVIGMRHEEPCRVGLGHVAGQVEARFNPFGEVSRDQVRRRVAGQVARVRQVFASLMPPSKVAPSKNCRGSTFRLVPSPAFPSTCVASLASEPEIGPLIFENPSRRIVGVASAPRASLFASAGPPPKQTDPLPASA